MYSLPFSFLREYGCFYVTDEKLNARYKTKPRNSKFPKINQKKDKQDYMTASPTLLSNQK